jgi:hypothetical protein
MKQAVLCWRRIVVKGHKNRYWLPL